MQYFQLSDQSNQFIFLTAKKQESNDLISRFESSFSILEDGQVKNIRLDFTLDLAPQAMNVVLASDPDLSTVLATASQEIELSLHPGEIVAVQTLLLNQPVEVTAGETYHLRLSFEAGALAVTLLGTALANEGAWDDAIPMRVEGYDG